MAKNFSVPLGRIKAALATQPSGVSLSFDSLILDTNSGIAIAGEKAVQLRPTEAKLLAILLLSKDRFRRREEIFDALYGHRADGGPESLHVVNQWVTHLRQKIAPLGYGLHNSHRFGWRLVKC